MTYDELMQLIFDQCQRAKVLLSHYYALGFTDGDISHQEGVVEAYETLIKLINEREQDNE